MKNTQKGATGVIALIVVIVLGAIIWAYARNDNDDYKAPNTNTGTVDNNYTPVTNNSGNTSNTEQPAGLGNSDTVNTGSTVVTANSNVFPGGVTYKLSYGLTMQFPASWAPYVIAKTQESYGGVVPTDSTTITLPDGPVLRINTFTKQQWNSIKTQENAANQNTPSLGEGEYLGENSTYIYSYIILGHETEAKQVLRNIISF